MTESSAAETVSQQRTAWRLWTLAAGLVLAAAAVLSLPLIFGDLGGDRGVVNWFTIFFGTLLITRDLGQFSQTPAWRSNARLKAQVRSSGLRGADAFGAVQPNARLAFKRQAQSSGPLKRTEGSGCAWGSSAKRPPGVQTPGSKLKSAQAD